MDAHHRKIDLQSPQDLTYLLSNIRTAAQQKLDLHIPPSAAPKGEDAFRTKVEELVFQYIHDTLSLALPSLSINGLDASPSLLLTHQPTPSPSSSSSTATPSSSDDPNYEPYDSRLATKLRSLYATLESETTRVAQLRRDAPAQAALNYTEALRKEMAEEEKALQEARRRAVEDAEGGLEGVALARPEGVREGWERGWKELGELRGITEVVARLERAKEVVGVLEGR